MSGSKNYELRYAFKIDGLFVFPMTYPQQTLSEDETERVIRCLRICDNTNELEENKVRKFLMTPHKNPISIRVLNGRCVLCYDICVIQKRFLRH